MDALANSALTLLSTVAQLVLVALGLAVIYGLMRVINFAHGEFLSLGGFTVLVLLRADVNIWLAMLAAPVVVGLVGLVTERLIIRFLYGRLVDSLLATFGLSLVIAQLLVVAFGNSPSGMKTVLGNFQIGQYRVEQYRVVLVVLTVALMGATWFVFTKTMYGVRARAALASPETAASVGINTERVNMVTFALGAALAGAAGALLAPLIVVEPYMGQKFVARAFLIVISGGGAALTGAGVAGSILGTAQHVGTVAATPFVGQAAVLLVAIVIVRFFPRGLSARWRSEI